MKRILLAASFITLFSSASFALEPECNPAIQNWVNGSQDTCPIIDHDNNNKDNARYERCVKAETTVSAKD